MGAELSITQRQLVSRASAGRESSEAHRLSNRARRRVTANRLAMMGPVRESMEALRDQSEASGGDHLQGEYPAVQESGEVSAPKEPEA